MSMSRHGKKNAMSQVDPMTFNTLQSSITLLFFFVHNHTNWASIVYFANRDQVVVSFLVINQSDMSCNAVVEDTNSSLPIT